MSQQIELTDRQESVVSTFAQLKRDAGRGVPVTASDIASSMGVDSRGVGQTLRRVRDQLSLVEGPDEDGGYKFTAKGRGVAQRLANRQPAAA